MRGTGLGAAARHRNDPLDEGNLPPELLPLSRNLARLLRHSWTEQGLGRDGEGWMRLDEIQKLEGFTQYTLQNFRTVVEESYSHDFKRFEVEMKDDGKRWIRARHKRSSGFGTRENTPPPLRNVAVPPLQVPDRPPPRRSDPDDQPARCLTPPPPEIRDVRSTVGPARVSAAMRFLDGSPADPEPVPVRRKSGSSDATSEPDPWQSGEDPWAKKVGDEKHRLRRAAGAKNKSVPTTAPETKPQAEAVPPPPGPPVDDGDSPRAPERFTISTPSDSDSEVQEDREPRSPRNSGGVDLEVSKAESAERSATAARSEVQAPPTAEPETTPCLTPEGDEETMKPQPEETPSTGHVSSTGDSWQSFLNPEGDLQRLYWWCQRQDGAEDFFFEDEPGAWCKCIDQGSGEPMWYNSETEEYFAVPE